MTTLHSQIEELISKLAHEGDYAAFARLGNMTGYIQEAKELLPRLRDEDEKQASAARKILEERDIAYHWLQSTYEEFGVTDMKGAHITEFWKQIRDKCKKENERDAKQETTGLDEEAAAHLKKYMADLEHEASSIPYQPLGDSTMLDCEDERRARLLDAREEVRKIIARLRAARRVPALKWQKEKPTEPCWCVATGGRDKTYGEFEEDAYSIYAPEDFPIRDKHQLFLTIPAPTEETVEPMETLEAHMERLEAKTPQPAEVGLSQIQYEMINDEACVVIERGRLGDDTITLSELIACIDEWKRRNNG